ncbi:hypothetical protein GJ654_12460 [Rhodoblastus acidophilus]|uniref:Uncharacterized protein n=1 Tax=Rhodoblastus acidophilus TaxID=1074 RepID=A0A6N8DN96_RHOAC|nr:hypothetical protein [Rhodoblastus acidophilus]MCW2275309.1 hypothetical protein [Rhodoblastus acidophilus]MTV31798.1 hypothetical protein [Rhodoblastus acidophilus]
MEYPHKAKGIIIARVGALPTRGRPDITPRIAKVYEEIGCAPDVTTSDLLTSLITLTGHLGIVSAQKDKFSAKCRLGVRRTIDATLALLAARQAGNQFELTQKILVADLVENGRSALYWALLASIHTDVRLIFPHFDREAAENWIRRLREQCAAD